MAAGRKCRRTLLDIMYFVTRSLKRSYITSNNGFRIRTESFEINKTMEGQKLSHSVYMCAPFIV